MKTKVSVHATSGVADENIAVTMQKKCYYRGSLLRVTAWVIRWIRLLSKMLSKTNIVKESEMQVDILSVEALRAPGVVVVKGVFLKH